jgi:UDP-N-acetylglucosamine 2-epimerase
MYAMIGGYLNIATIHVFSGDHTEDGYIDNPIRHATSKLSSAHFVTLKEHKKRLVRMGENPKRVFEIGNISLDKFISYKPMLKSEIQEYFNIDKKFEDFALMIFHPVTEEIEKVDEYFENKELQIRYETYYKISQLNNEDKIELKNIIDESIKEKEK